LLLQVDGGELPAPTIFYERNAPKQPFEGRWNFANEQLFHRKNPHFTPLVLRGSRVNVGVANQIFKNLALWSSDTYKVAKVTRTPLIEVNTNNLGTISSALERNAGNVNFALFLLDGKNIPAYSSFKDLCDRRYGLHAICLANQKCKNENDKQRWSNIILKMNLKAAGINHTVNSRLIGPLGSFMETALVLGADVTHPGPGSVPGCPSIAAIVGSVDRHAGRFLGSMRLQRTPRAEVSIFSHLQD
jgi:eukaryotic translation initiation factor 2C